MTKLIEGDCGPAQGAPEGETGIRVGVVHTNPLTLWALRQLLDREPDIEVRVAEPSLSQEMVGQLDVLIVDRHVVPPSLTTMLAADTASHVQILIMTGQDGPTALEDKAGRRPNCPLNDRSSPQAIVTTVRAAALQAPCDSPRAAETPLRGSVRDGRTASALSSRERQVVAHIAMGLTHDQIALRLGISRHTVDTYVKRARRKLGPGNKADLTRAAMAHGFDPSSS